MLPDSCVHGVGLRIVTQSLTASVSPLGLMSKLVVPEGSFKVTVHRFPTRSAMDTPHNEECIRMLRKPVRSVASLATPA